MRARRHQPVAARDVELAVEPHDDGLAGLRRRQRTVERADRVHDGVLPARQHPTRWPAVTTPLRNAATVAARAAATSADRSRAAPSRPTAPGARTSLVVFDAGTREPAPATPATTARVPGLRVAGRDHVVAVQRRDRDRACSLTARGGRPSRGSASTMVLEGLAARSRPGSSLLTATTIVRESRASAPAPSAAGSAATATPSTTPRWRRSGSRRHRRCWRRSPCCGCTARGPACPR